MPSKTETNPASFISCINSGSSTRLRDASGVKLNLVLCRLRHSVTATHNSLARAVLPMKLSSTINTASRQPAACNWSNSASGRLPIAWSLRLDSSASQIFGCARHSAQLRQQITSPDRQNLFKKRQVAVKQRVLSLETLVALWPRSASNTPQASQSAPSSGDQIEDQNDHSDHQQKVNQTAGDMKAESQQPQDHENHKDCPKHTFSFASRAPRESNSIPRRPQAFAFDS